MTIAYKIQPKDGTSQGSSFIYVNDQTTAVRKDRNNLAGDEHSV